MRGNFSNHFCDYYYCVCAGKRNRSLLSSPPPVYQGNEGACMGACVTTGVVEIREKDFSVMLWLRDCMCTSAARQLKQRNRIPTARFPPFFCKIGNFLSFFSVRQIECCVAILCWSGPPATVPGLEPLTRQKSGQKSRLSHRNRQDNEKRDSSSSILSLLFLHLFLFGESLAHLQLIQTSGWEDQLHRRRWRRTRTIPNYFR